MWHRRMVAPRTPDRAADLAARHEAVALVNRQPDALADAERYDAGRRPR